MVGHGTAAQPRLLDTSLSFSMASCHEAYAVILWLRDQIAKLSNMVFWLKSRNLMSTKFSRNMVFDTLSRAHCTEGFALLYFLHHMSEVHVHRVGWRGMKRVVLQTYLNAVSAFVLGLAGGSNLALLPGSSPAFYAWLELLPTHTVLERLTGCAGDRVTLLTVTALDATHDDKGEF